MRCAAARAMTRCSSRSATSGRKRADRYSELRASLTPAAHEQPKVEMFYIGG